MPAPHLTKDLLFTVFLPGLLFEAAFHLEWRELRENVISIGSLAVPGVAAATGLTALLLTPAIRGLGVAPDDAAWGPALLFGALISATDPIAVVATFRQLGAPRRLTVLVEAESLVNDGTAAVLFTVLLGLAAGVALTTVDVLLRFVLVAAGGIAIGIGLGWLLSQLVRRIDEPVVEIAITTIAAYGSFAVAETLHVSGVLATVAAGVVCGDVAVRSGMSAKSTEATHAFWDFIGFGMNSVVFLLVGFEVSARQLLDWWKPILIAFVAITLARAAIVFLTAGVVRSRTERVPRSWLPVLVWGGLRGALSMVLALSLPDSYAYRDLLVAMTFGVVTLTIVVQGLTIAPLVRRAQNA